MTPLFERQQKIASLLARAEGRTGELLDHLRQAESCETEDDFEVNLDEAAHEARRLLEEIDEARRKLVRAAAAAVRPPRKGRRSA